MLPALLSRLAALQGHAIPWHRFSMMSVTPDGVPIDALTLANQATELWLACFPGADVRELTLPLSVSDAPALWLEDDADSAHPARVLIVRGCLSAGTLSCVDAEGAVVDLPPQQAERGRLLSLPAQTVLANDAAHSDPSRQPKPLSAGQWFRHAILKRKQVFIEGAVATATVNILALVTSFYSMQVYDRVVPTQGYPTLWVLSVGVLIAVLLELGMRQVRSRIVERGCSAIDEELSAVFFNQALSIRMDSRPRTVGTFAAQIRHFESVRNFMTASTLFVFADAPFALLFVLVIALIAGPVALVPALFLPIAVFAGIAFRRPLARMSEAHMNESNVKNGLLIDAIDGIESIKATNAEWKTLDRWRALTHTLARDSVAMKDLTTLSTNLTQTLQQLCYIAIVCAGVYAIGNGNLTMGGLIACTIISGRALTPMAQVSGLIVQWQHARVALKALDGIMAMPTDSPPGERQLVPDRSEGRLRIESLKYAYGPDTLALTVANLNIRAGERVAILGPIGSGKSTLLKLLSGLYRPTEGRVFLDDLDMAHLAPAFLREHVGYLPQDVRLFQGTLRDNLALGLPSPTDDQILAAARRTGLDRVIASHPRGLGIEISEGGRGLSGGQRQLVGLTRLVLAQPRVLLLDEPTASMDSQLEDFIAERVFGQQAASTTLVVVTHKPTMLRHFNRIVIVDRGRILADGPRDELLRRLQGNATTAQAAVRGTGPGTEAEQAPTSSGSTAQQRVAPNTPSPALKAPPQ